MTDLSAQDAERLVGRLVEALDRLREAIAVRPAAHQDAAAARFPDPREEPTMSIERAAGFYGLSVSAAYDAAARGDIPTIKFGRRLLVPTQTVAEQLKLTNGAAQ